MKTRTLLKNISKLSILFITTTKAMAAGYYGSNGNWIPIGSPTTNLTENEISDATRIFCSTVGFTGAMNNQVEEPCIVDNNNQLAKWVSFFKMLTLFMTIRFGYIGSGIDDRYPINLKFLMIAGGLSALTLQYEGIMNNIASILG